MKPDRRKIVTLALAIASFCAPAPKMMAATLTVTTTADSGARSLQAALASDANADTIDATGVSGTITLTSGELVVGSSVTILARGQTGGANFE